MMLRAAACCLFAVWGGCGIPKEPCVPDDSPLIPEQPDLFISAADFCAFDLDEVDPETLENPWRGLLEYCRLVQSCRLTTAEFYGICGLPIEERRATLDVDQYCANDHPPVDRPDFSTRVSRLASDAEASCSSDSPSGFAVVAECPGGDRAVAAFDGLHTLITIHDATTGAHVGEFNWQDDAPIVPCCGQFWWPAVPECREPVISEVICGEGLHIGDVLDLHL